MDKFDFTEDELASCEGRILSAAGLALKAGKCTVGTELSVQNIRDGAAKLVLMPCDVSDNSKKRIHDTCSFHETPFIVLPCDKLMFASRLGRRSAVSCAAITDEGFVKIINKIYEEVHIRLTEVHQ